MGKVKAVLDTNILIATLFKKTLTREFSEIIEKKKVELYSSEEILKEFARALTYPKIENMLKKSGIDKKIALESVVEKLKIVKPKIKIDLIKEDLADNKVLECGMEAKVNYIASGDKHLLKLGKFKNIEIITARKFLEKLH
jgi:putative PIN family toxin of toxin-antitoxin system